MSVRRTRFEARAIGPLMWAVTGPDHTRNEDPLARIACASVRFGLPFGTDGMRGNAQLHAPINQRRVNTHAIYAVCCVCRIQDALPRIGGKSRHARRSGSRASAEYGSHRGVKADQVRV